MRDHKGLRHESGGSVHIDEISPRVFRVHCDACQSEATRYSLDSARFVAAAHDVMHTIDAEHGSEQ